MKSVLAKRKDSLYGIVNGIDRNVWNPEKDKLIPANYSQKNIEEKLTNKKELAERFGLVYDESVPIIGLISRLFDSKGLDLVQKAFNDLMKLNVQIILLGTGETKYHTFFDKMPSKYEPCGLNQMYSLVYGTVPIVRETGGLADTVIKYNDKTEEGTGFVFKKYDAAEMLKEIKRALKVFEDKKIWQKIMRAGMKLDFSWDVSAKRYIELYKT